MKRFLCVLWSTLIDFFEVTVNFSKDFLWLFFPAFLLFSMLRFTFSVFQVLPVSSRILIFLLLLMLEHKLLLSEGYLFV